MLGERPCKSAISSRGGPSKTEIRNEFPMCWDLVQTQYCIVIDLMTRYHPEGGAALIGIDRIAFITKDGAVLLTGH